MIDGPIILFCFMFRLSLPYPFIGGIKSKLPLSSIQYVYLIYFDPKIVKQC